ncbi:hypothetical protein Mgra_00008075 [Meloidogyne graminicola]|uniref:Uncharacterized protein n=1 Tax=Meloidogyne graminicola TaxID=189291 RepID=A0A8S9ZGR7_9BILA|nr:hypothetical protein Mgra_00008075 [Meloidogyne graminicola]
MKLLPILLFLLFIINSEAKLSSCRSCNSVMTIPSITTRRSKIHDEKIFNRININPIYEKAPTLGGKTNTDIEGFQNSIKIKQFTNSLPKITMSNNNNDDAQKYFYAMKAFRAEILNLKNCDFFSSLNNFCKKDQKIREFNIYVKNLIENENEKNKLKKYGGLEGLGKKVNVEQINNDEKNLGEQFSKYTYEKYNDLDKAIRESSSVLNNIKVFNLMPVVSFLRILQFCATIKHSFKLYKINKSTQSVIIYCKYYVLPEAREILNFAKIEYKFGKFAIKIDNKNEKLIKVDDWLVEEEEVEVKEKINIVKPKPFGIKGKSKVKERLETINEGKKEGEEEEEEEDKENEEELFD